MRKLIALFFCALLFLQQRPEAQAYARFLTEREDKIDCRNYHTDFSRSAAGWLAENSYQDTYEITSDGVKMNLVPPINYVRMHDAQSNLFPFCFLLPDQKH